jgi:LexA-binding, inner membrane-associated putative hydrolase
VRARLAIGCLGTVAVADYVIERVDLPWLAVGLFDEPAHLATGCLLGGPDPLFLAGSLLPDLDHVPLAFRDPKPGDPRPKTHSLCAAALTALVSRRLAAGVLAHFARDLAVQPGVPLLWPLTGRQLRIPYACYAAALVASAALRTTGRVPRRPGSGSRRAGPGASATDSA